MADVTTEVFRIIRAKHNWVPASLSVACWTAFNVKLSPLLMAIPRYLIIGEVWRIWLPTLTHIFAMLFYLLISFLYFWACPCLFKSVTAPIIKECDDQHYTRLHHKQPPLTVLTVLVCSIPQALKLRLGFCSIHPACGSTTAFGPSAGCPYIEM